jgi:hypothetical protein
MKVLKIEKEGKHLITLEKYHIHKMSKKNGLLMKDTYIDICNPVIEAL